MKANNVIKLIKDIQKEIDKNEIQRLALKLPKELSKVNFLDREDLKIFIYDLHLKIKLSSIIIDSIKI